MTSGYFRVFWSEVWPETCVCVWKQEEAAGGGRGQGAVAESDHPRKSLISVRCLFWLPLTSCGHRSNVKHQTLTPWNVNHRHNPTNHSSPSPLPQVTEPSLEDLQLDKKESEVEASQLWCQIHQPHSSIFVLKPRARVCRRRRPSSPSGQTTRGSFSRTRREPWPPAWTPRPCPSTGRVNKWPRSAFRLFSAKKEKDYVRVVQRGLVFISGI